MPSSILNTDIAFPNLTGKTTEQSLFIIMNYLYMLKEQLSYSLTNLGLGNMNPAGLSDMAGVINEPILVRLEGVDGSLAEFTVMLGQIRTELQDAEGNISSLQQTASNLTARIEDAEGNINTLYMDAQQTANTISDIEGNVSTLQQTASSLTSQITDAEGDISQLQQTAQSLTSRISTVEGNYSQISQTVNGIETTVSDIEGDVSTLFQTSSSLTSRVSSAEGNISQLQQTATSLTSQVGNLDDQYTQIVQTVNGLTLSAVNGSQSSQIVLSSGGIQLSSTTVSFSGMVTFNDLSDPYSQTVIDGGLLRTGTVTASTIEGETVYLLDEYGDRAGRMELSAASSASYSVDFSSQQAMRVRARGGDLYLANGAGDSILLDESEAACFFYCDIAPQGDAIFNCGTSPNRWDAVYSESGVLTTSDQERKKNIEELPEKYITMLDNITPYRFKYDSGTSGRYHTAFVAQDVKAAMDKAGVSDIEFAGWCQGEDAQGNPLFMLRYQEFEALMLAKIQQIDKRLKLLEAS